ncbi:MAG: sialidase family protein [Planctomycetaceae bacterium]
MCQQFLSGLTCLFLTSLVTCAGADPAIVHEGFIYEKASYPECHASTIEETPAGLVAAWFGGTGEKYPDVGIWVSRHIDGHWTPSVEVADGIQYTLTDGTVKRHPTWNPVLFQYPGGPLVLFWKCGPSPSTWWGMMSESSDNGITWSQARRLPEHIDGPVRNKPVLQKDGTLLCGSSTESDGWRVHFELTSDHGKTWQRTPAIHDGKTFGAIQPTLLRHPDGVIQALCRNRDGDGMTLSTTSSDQGRSWSDLKPLNIPNPNSGIDAVTLQDGRHLLVYNHTNRSKGSPRGREMINVAVSEDGIDWKPSLTLDREAKAEFSYPAVIQAKDGKVHITYTWKRRKVRYFVVDPDKLTLKDWNGGAWPD